MNKLAKCSVFFVLCFSIFAFFSCSNVQYNGNSCTVRIDIPAEIPGEVLTPEEYVFDFELKNSGATVYKTGHAGETVYFYVAPGAVSFKCSVISVSNSKILYYGTKNTSIIFGMNAVIDFDLVKVKDDSGDPSDPDPDPARSSDYSTAKVGDIILSDGTILKKDATYDFDTMTAVAIIVREQGAKPAMGMGIYNAKAERETSSFGKEMSTAVCWYGSSYSGGIGDYIPALNGAIGTGYVDGEDCYDQLLAVSDIDANTIKNYYHAIYGARDYANTCSLTGDFATGWYLPTVDEWNTATENIAEIRSSLEKVDGDGIEKASNNVNVKYWTCNTTSTNYATQFTPATRTPTDNAGRTGSAYIRAFRLFRN